MPSIIDQLTEIYVFIDDHLKQHPEKVLRFQTSYSPARRRASGQSHSDARQYG